MYLHSGSFADWRAVHHRQDDRGRRRQGQGYRFHSHWSCCMLCDPDLRCCCRWSLSMVPRTDPGRHIRVSLGLLRPVRTGGDIQQRGVPEGGDENTDSPAISVPRSLGLGHRLVVPGRAHRSQSCHRCGLSPRQEQDSRARDRRSHSGRSLA